MTKHTPVKHFTCHWGDTLMKSDHLIEPRNPSKNSATRFYFKVAPSSISKTNFHFRLQLLPSLQIILYFHVVLKKIIKKNKKKTFQAARPSCSVVHLNQRLQWNSSNHLFMSICVTGMKAVVTSIPGWQTQKFQTESPPSTDGVKTKSALFICIKLTCFPCQMSQIR